MQGFSTWAKPLTHILKSTEFEKKFNQSLMNKTLILRLLNPAEVEAGNCLKKALMEAPVLVIDDLKPTKVWADTLKENQSPGEALMQIMDKGSSP